MRTFSPKPADIQRVWYEIDAYGAVLGRLAAEVARVLRDLLAKVPEETVRGAVRGMLPRGALGRQMLKKLKVYAGPSHPHGAQMPRPLEVDHSVHRVS